MNVLALTPHDLDATYGLRHAKKKKKKQHQLNLGSREGKSAKHNMDGEVGGGTKNGFANSQSAEN